VRDRISHSFTFFFVSHFACSSLTRRFTILRTSSGNPVSLEDLRTRFAEQRARGADNQISEEEEDMILETLGRFRSNNASSLGRANNDSPTSPVNSPYADYQSTIDRQSIQSTKTASSSSFAPASLPSSPTGRFTKRYSNNLFGSGRFRDDTYFRSVGSHKSGIQRGALSTIPSDAPGVVEDSPNSDSARPTTPDSSAVSSSVQSSPENVAKIHSAPPMVLTDHPVSVAEYRLSKVLGSAVYKRASLALEEAIKEIEEEAEDEIVMPRSAPASRTVIPEQSRSSDPVSGPMCPQSH
jgi:serine/arginine repetitive matrix protein 2